MTAPDPLPEDSFTEFAKATGLEDLFTVDASSINADDDSIGATDSDGDSLALVYMERTADDGEAVGVTSIHTDGPTGVALVGIEGMEELISWLQARVIRAKALKAEQGL